MCQLAIDMRESCGQQSGQAAAYRVGKGRGRRVGQNATVQMRPVVPSMLIDELMPRVCEPQTAAHGTSALEETTNTRDLTGTPEAV